MTQVYTVSIICPSTDKRVDTGIEAISKEALEAEYPWEQVLTCSGCGQKHMWSAASAIVQVDDSRSEDSNVWRPNR